jgi:hypothetical protein
MDMLLMSYEQIIAQLRAGTLTDEQRDRLIAELRARDRVLHNQWVTVCGGEFK